MCTLKMYIINSAGTHGRFGELVDRVAGFQYRSLGMGGREGGRGTEGGRGREGGVCLCLCVHMCASL